MKQDMLIHLQKINDVKPGQLHGVIAEKTNLLIAEQDGIVSVFEGICPHQGALLAEGKIEDGNIVCPAHQWKFNCTSGNKAGSQTVCLKKFDAVISEGNISISRDELLTWKKSKKKVSEPEETPIIQIAELPGPSGWPLVGNLPAILSDKDNLHKTLYKWYLKYGSIYRIKGLVGTTGIVISNAKLSREIFTDRPHSFSRIKTMGRAMEEVGLNGLITAEGDLWKRYRKFATNGLSNKLLREYYQTIERSTGRLFKLLMKAAKSNRNIEIQKDLLKYSVDVTSSLAFGVDINTLENGEDKLQDHLALVLPMVQRRMMIPVPYWRYLKLPIDYKLDKSLVIIKEAIHGFMKSAKARIDADPGLKSNPTNFLEALLATQDEEGDRLTDEEVFTNVFSILLAGEDSTANSIAWVIHYMTELPEVQRRMQEEVDRIFGNNFSLLSFDQLQQLTYIEAVIQEALRLRPVLPIVQLCANEDMVISNVHVPKGTNVHLTMYNMFMNDDYFENSSDFNPDRWLSPDASNKNGMKEAYLPFGFGPRICPGKSLALLESKAVLSMICRYFTVRKSNKEKDVTEKFSGVMQPVDLFVKIKLREHVSQELETMGAAQVKGKCPMGYS